MLQTQSFKKQAPAHSILQNKSIKDGDCSWRVGRWPRGAASCTASCSSSSSCSSCENRSRPSRRTSATWRRTWTSPTCAATCAASSQVRPAQPGCTTLVLFAQCCTDHAGGILQFSSPLTSQSTHLSLMPSLDCQCPFLHVKSSLQHPSPFHC